MSKFAQSRSSIGALVELYGVTPRALRFYEERGLISVGRDRQNVRVYGPEARADVELIVQLRRFGVGLPDILEVLEARRESPGRELIKIEGKLKNIARELDARRAEIGRVLENIGPRLGARAA